MAEKATFACDFPGCDKVYPKQWRLKEHQCSTHTGERAFICKHEGCTKSYVRNSHLKRHIQMSHSEEKPFKCSWEGCGATFSVAYNLKKHKKRHDLPNPYSCEEDGCDCSFRKRSQLLNHVESCHPGRKQYSCTVESCSAQFTSKQKLEKHERRHVEGYNCPRPDCDVNVPTWTALQEHIKSHPKSFKCTLCDETLPSRIELQQHKSIHNLESKDVTITLTCPFEGCNRSYSKQSNLQAHIDAFHEGLKPFKCKHEGCSSCFAFKVSNKQEISSTTHCLLRHMKLHRRGKKEEKKRPRRPLSSKISGYIVKHTPEPTPAINGMSGALQTNTNVKS
ncbi:transcription factor IIIA-like isoform X1 [Dysidea avara]|uniref:transcription factor IIIA-like isoform X1 n=1 Tax=Dysidea avara TaxID=196820 RepID=UPI003321C8D2